MERQSDTVLIATLAITAFFSFAGVVFQGIMAYLMARLNKKQDKAAEATAEVAIAAQEVKEQLETTNALAVVATAEVKEQLKATNELAAVKLAKVAERVKGCRDDLLQSNGIQTVKLDHVVEKVEQVAAVLEQSESAIRRDKKMPGE